MLSVDEIDGNREKGVYLWRSGENAPEVFV